jgi:membrane associated rhomboid family serine protease
MTEAPKDHEIQGLGQPPKERQPIFMLPPAIAALGLIMLAIQAVSAFVLNEAQVNQFAVWFGFVPIRLLAPEQFPGGILPLFWTPLTYGFLHGGWEPVAGNVAWLVIFGTPVARRYGAVRTLVIFFVSSIIGALAFAMTEFNSVAYLVGASGGIAGLTGAAVRFIFQPPIAAQNPETGEIVQLGRQMASIPDVLRSPQARNFSIIWIVLNCLVPIVPIFLGQDIGIAWQAHLGGFFTGLLLVPFFEHAHGPKAA